METKQTAVEFLYQELRNECLIDMADELFIKAKQMEKEQIKQAFKDCHDLGHIYGLDTEQYYKEIYGK